jgi:hypothetical protein
MNGGTKRGVSTISLKKLQCARWNSVGPTQKKKKKKKKKNKKNRRKVSREGLCIYWKLKALFRVSKHTLRPCAEQH